MSDTCQKLNSFNLTKYFFYIQRTVIFMLMCLLSVKSLYDNDSLWNVTHLDLADVTHFNAFVFTLTMEISSHSIRDGNECTVVYEL
jgi:hypothetical protein